MIIKIDKKEIDLYKEACIFHDLTFQEYTNEANDQMVTAEITLDYGNRKLEPSPAVCLLLGRQVQMNWQKQVEKETELFKSVKR